MCDLRSASYRHGKVVEAHMEGLGKRSLSVSESLEVGRSIRDRLPTYMALSCERVGKAFEAFGETIGFGTPRIDFDESGTLSSRYDPGLILDFPPISVSDEQGRRVLEARTCITVCVGPMRSKVWTRANTVGDWDVIPANKLAAIHKVFDEACQSVNNILVSKYQEDFARFVKSDVDLRTYGNISVFAADCERDASGQIRVLYDQVRDNPLSHKEIDNEYLAGALRSVTNAAAVEQVHDAGAGDSFEVNEAAKLYPFLGLNGAPSIFVRYASDKNAYFAGIVDGNRDVNPEWNDYSPMRFNSVGTTAEIAAFFGGAF